MNRIAFHYLKTFTEPFVFTWMKSLLYSLWCCCVILLMGWFLPIVVNTCGSRIITEYRGKAEVISFHLKRAKEEEAFYFNDMAVWNIPTIVTHANVKGICEHAASFVFRSIKTTSSICTYAQHVYPWWPIIQCLDSSEPALSTIQWFVSSG